MSLDRDGDVRVGVEADVVERWMLARLSCGCCQRDPWTAGHLLLWRTWSWAVTRQHGAEAERGGVIRIHEVHWSLVVGILIVLPLIRNRVLILKVALWGWRKTTTINPDTPIATDTSAECGLWLWLVIALAEGLEQLCGVKFLILRRIFVARCRWSDEIFGLCDTEARLERLGWRLDDWLHGHVHMVLVPFLVLDDLGLNLLLKGSVASSLLIL